MSDLSNNHKIIPNEQNKWYKYIEKTKKLIQNCKFTLINKNNVENIYEYIYGNYKIITSFRFKGNYYKERECKVAILLKEQVINEFTHYTSKKIYYYIKEFLINNEDFKYFIKNIEFNKNYYANIIDDLYDEDDYDSVYYNYSYFE